METFDLRHENWLLLRKVNVQTKPIYLRYFVGAKSAFMARSHLSRYLISENNDDVEQKGMSSNDSIKTVNEEKTSKYK